MENNNNTMIIYGWDDAKLQRNKIHTANVRKQNILILNCVEAILDLWVLRYLNEVLIKNKEIQCTMICGMLESLDSYNDLELKALGCNLPKDNCKIIIWTEYFIWFTLELISGHQTFKKEQGVDIHSYKDEYYNLNLNYRMFDRPFASFNGKIAKHRSQFMEKLAEHKIIQEGFVTYHGLRKEMDYDPKNEMWKYTFFDPKMIEKNNLKYKMDIPKTIISADINETFTKSFLHIPCETYTSHFVLTEKTILPILLKYPFLTVGSKDFHKKMQNLGFQLYDEIFDYGFDKEDLPLNRIEGIINNIKYIIVNFDKVYEMQKRIKSKLEYNHNLCIDMIKNKKNYPVEIIENLDHYTLQFVKECYTNENFDFLFKLWN